MKLKIEDFIAPSIDPMGNPASSFPPDEFLEALRLDPSLAIENADLPNSQIASFVAEDTIHGLLKQQQFLVYDMASSMGVLSSFVEPTKLSLRAFDISIDSMNAIAVGQKIVATTLIGTAGQALSAVPNIYAQIAGALIGLGLQIYELVLNPSLAKPRVYLPCQEWTEETDAAVFHNMRVYTRNNYDWTGVFLPRFQGELSMQICKHDDGPHGLVWGLGNGQVPHVRLVGSSKNRRFSFGEDGEFNPANGIGVIPGGQRIYSLVQSTPIDYRSDYLDFSKDHPTVFDPRCGGGDRDVMSIDTGGFYPTVAQAGVTLWDFMFQRGAAMYAVDTGTLGDSWIHYFKSIWEGVSMLWGNPEYIGSGSDNDDVGYGAGVWEGSLAQLVRNYGVGMNNEIGGIGSWAPAGCRSWLQSEDQDHFFAGSVLTKIILPAVSQLAHAQRWHLRNTTLAAYLPIYGGKNANPLTQGDNGSDVMGAFRSSEQLRADFANARARILQTDLKYQVRLQDVLDKKYRDEIEAAGGGIHGVGGLGLAAELMQPFDGNIWVPTGGSGFGREGGGRLPRGSGRNTTALIVGGLVLTGGVVAAYRYRNEIVKWSRGMQRKTSGFLPRVRRMLPGR